MRFTRFIPSTLAGVVILASGCARTDNTQASDSAMTETQRPATPKGPTNNPAGKLDDYNARTSATDTGAALGTTNDTIAQRGAPQPSDTTRKRP